MEMVTPEILNLDNGPKVLQIELPEGAMLSNAREDRLERPRKAHQTLGIFNAEIIGNEHRYKEIKPGDPIPQDLSLHLFGLTLAMINEEAQVGRLTLDKYESGATKRELIVIEAPKIRHLTFDEGYPKNILCYEPETAGKTGKRLAFVFDHNLREFQLLGYANGNSPEDLKLQAIYTRGDLADGLEESTASHAIRPGRRDEDRTEQLSLYVLQVLFQYGLDGIIPATGTNGRIVPKDYRMVSYGNLFEGYMGRSPEIIFSFSKAQGGLEVKSTLNFVFDNSKGQ
jgi:hypothetical protein